MKPQPLTKEMRVLISDKRGGYAYNSKHSKFGSFYVVEDVASAVAWLENKILSDYKDKCLERGTILKWIDEAFARVERK